MCSSCQTKIWCTSLCIMKISTLFQEDNKLPYWYDRSKYLIGLKYANPPKWKSITKYSKVKLMPCYRTNQSTLRSEYFSDQHNFCNHSWSNSGTCCTLYKASCHQTNFTGFSNERVEQLSNAIIHDTAKIWKSYHYFSGGKTMFWCFTMKISR